MDFEYDPEKSARNKDKHGLDFEEAQALWSDENAIRLEAPHSTELRYLIVGKIGEKTWTAICTERDNRTRIISVRRSRKDEQKAYFG